MATKFILLLLSSSACIAATSGTSLRRHARLGYRYAARSRTSAGLSDGGAPVTACVTPRPPITLTTSNPGGICNSTNLTVGACMFPSNEGANTTAAMGKLKGQRLQFSRCGALMSFEVSAAATTDRANCGGGLKLVAIEDAPTQDEVDAGKQSLPEPRQCPDGKRSVTVWPTSYLPPASDDWCEGQCMPSSDAVDKCSLCQYTEIGCDRCSWCLAGAECDTKAGATASLVQVADKSLAHLGKTEVDRGPGIIPNQCPSGYEWALFDCVTKCPEGFTDMGTTCAKPNKSYGRGFGHTSKSGCGSNCEKCLLLWYPKCRDGYRPIGCNVCSPKCPSGSTDLGEFCTKKSKPASCPSSHPSKEAGLCYKKCPDEYPYHFATMCTKSKVVKDLVIASIALAGAVVVVASGGLAASAFLGASEVAVGAGEIAVEASLPLVEEGTAFIEEGWMEEMTSQDFAFEGQNYDIRGGGLIRVWNVGDPW